MLELMLLLILVAICWVSMVLSRAQDWRERPSVRDRCVLQVNADGTFSAWHAAVTGFDVNTIIGKGPTPAAALEDYDRQFAPAKDGE